MSQEEKVKEFMKMFVSHGMGCGEEIAHLLQERHPNALVFPLYRSAVALDKHEKGLVIYCCGDPHCMGGEIDAKTVGEWEREYYLSGQRFGVEFFEKQLGQYLRMDTTAGLKISSGMHTSPSDFEGKSDISELSEDKEKETT